MNRSIVKKDFIRNKMIHLALLLFMLFAACLAVLSVVMAVQTFTSIAELYKTAQPPHFVQMHKGEMNQEKIDEFMSEYDGLPYWQTDTMIDVYGESLTVVGKEGKYNLSDSRLDIGLVKQNDSKDLLLDSKHKRVIIEKGEVGIPVLLKETYGMEVGDRVILNSDGVTKEFVIKEFILDSMMNSTMASSTRILLSDDDFAELLGRVGEYEYLIEAYFTDSKEASNFQTAYENANLPQNGQAITYTIIFILSALTDIVTVFVLLLVSVLLIIVSFICVRFTILAALEEDIGEIGTMKAIGFSFRDIREHYLYKYRILALVGVTAGILLALLLSGVFTKHISTTFGEIRLSVMAVVVALAVGGMVFLLINFYCKKLLKRIKKITVIDALVSRKGFDKDGGIKDGLYKSRKLSVNWLLGIREVFYHFKKWVIVFAVVLIAELMMLIPINLLNTFEAPEFITYMGSSLEDVLIEVENGERLESNYFLTKETLEKDHSIDRYYESRRVLVQTVDTEGEGVNMHVDSGEQSGSGLQYLNGRAPDKENEIALSYLNADRIGKATGEKIVLFFNGNEQEFIISGVYQDVTSGGYTVKSTFNFSGLPAEKYTFSVLVNDDAEVEIKADEWTEILGTGVTVDPMEEFINQTLGGVAEQLRTIVLSIIAIGFLLVILITVLFLKLRMAKDQSEIAILKAVGFSERDIIRQYMIKMGSVSMLGIFMGIILTDVLGEKIVNAALSVAGLGIKQVDLISDPVIEYIVGPMVVILPILLVTWLMVRINKSYHIVAFIKE